MIFLKKLVYLVLEALRQTNLSMKERFEGLSAWREKQHEERHFLESKLDDARKHIETLTLQNQELSRKTGKDGKVAAGGSMVRIKPSRPSLFFPFQFALKHTKVGKYSVL